MSCAGVLLIAGSSVQYSVFYNRVPCFPAPPVNFLATVTRAESSVCSKCCGGCVCRCCSAGGGSELVIMVAADLLLTQRGEAKRPQGGFGDCSNLSLPSTSPSAHSISIFFVFTFHLFLSFALPTQPPPYPQLLKLHPGNWMIVPSSEEMFQGHRCVVNMVGTAVTEAFLKQRQGTGIKSQSPYRNHDKKDEDRRTCLTLCIDMLRCVVV